MSTGAPIPSIEPRNRLQTLVNRVREDEVARLLTLVVASLVVLITLLLFLALWSASAVSRHKFGFAFLINSVWDPVLEEFGALPFIYGSLVTTILALTIAVPLGVGAAVFLAELAPRRVSDALQFFIDLLAAVPSVVYGLLGILLVVPIMREYIQPGLKASLGFLPLFQGPAYGVCFLTAGIVLAIMVIPYIISVSREVLLSVPTEQREAALALGSTKWEATWKVVLPYARTGIFGSIFLAMARALGETMAVTMVIGNSPKISSSLFSSGDSIASVIANQFAEATSEIHSQALIELGLILFFLTFILNGSARLLILFTSKRGSALHA